jgi:hypothetical protein
LTRLIRSLALMTVIKNLGRHSSGGAAPGWWEGQWWRSAGRGKGSRRYRAVELAEGEKPGSSVTAFRSLCEAAASASSSVSYLPPRRRSPASSRRPAASTGDAGASASMAVERKGTNQGGGGGVSPCSREEEAGRAGDVAAPPSKLCRGGARSCRPLRTRISAGTAASWPWPSSRPSYSLPPRRRHGGDIRHGGATAPWPSSRPSCSLPPRASSDYRTSSPR